MQLVGYIDSLGQARLPLAIRGSRTSVTLDLALDTAFSGDLCLPIPTATQLGLELITTQEFELADGSVQEELVFLGFATLEAERSVEIVLTDSEEALLGTGLLSGTQVVIDFITGNVTITIPESPSGPEACI